CSIRSKRVSTGSPRYGYTNAAWPTAEYSATPPADTGYCRTTPTVMSLTPPGSCGPHPPATHTSCSKSNTLTMPQRIQRRSDPDWRMPPDARYVGRATRWANPFRVGADIPTEYHDYFQSIHGLWRGVKVVDRQYAVDLFTV